MTVGRGKCPAVFIAESSQALSGGGVQREGGREDQRAVRVAVEQLLEFRDNGVSPDAKKKDVVGGRGVNFDRTKRRLHECAVGVDINGLVGRAMYSCSVAAEVKDQRESIGRQARFYVQ